MPVNAPSNCRPIYGKRQYPKTEYCQSRKARNCPPPTQGGNQHARHLLPQQHEVIQTALSPCLESKACLIGVYALTIPSSFAELPPNSPCSAPIKPMSVR